MVDAAQKNILKNKYGDEQVFVTLFTGTASVADKFNRTDESIVKHLVSQGRYVFRYDAEYNMTFSQLIPYIIVMNKARTKIYVTKRIAGEERLRDSYALGAGGHVNPCDSAMDKYCLLAGAERELNEELNFRPCKGTELEYAGTVRDLQSNTGEHLGVVYIATAASVSVREKKNLKGIWMDYADLVKNYSAFESWGKHIIDYIFQTEGFMEKGDAENGHC